mmetsp:Transcript_21350/g.73628  ORF Transcript_21350/g.73628 Transcript_21350/m.73628 type:complete len:259 (-) Transcript_21350:130-906(-)
MARPRLGPPRRHGAKHDRAARRRPRRQRRRRRRLASAGRRRGVRRLRVRSARPRRRRRRGGDVAFRGARPVLQPRRVDAVGFRERRGVAARHLAAVRFRVQPAPRRVRRAAGARGAVPGQRRRLRVGGARRRVRRGRLAERGRRPARLWSHGRLRALRHDRARRGHGQTRAPERAQGALDVPPRRARRRQLWHLRFARRRRPTERTPRALARRARFAPMRMHNDMSPRGPRLPWSAKWKKLVEGGFPGPAAGPPGSRA